MARDLNRTGGTQAIYEAARDAEYARLGEHHGYSGLAAGVSAVLASRGVHAEPMELTSDFHSQLVGMADRADTATVQDIVRHFDSQMHFSSTLPYEVENVGRFNAPYSYSSVDTGWIRSEIDKKLKADKIRRGTKKYREFVEKNAGRVVSAVRDAVRERADKQAAGQREWVEKHRGEVDKVERSVAHLDRTEEILVALADVAGVEPKSISKLRERREVFRRAADSMRSSLAHALEPVEADEESVLFALELPNLKPFAEAAGVLTGNEARGKRNQSEKMERNMVMGDRGKWVVYAFGPDKGSDGLFKSRRIKGFTSNHDAQGEVNRQHKLGRTAVINWEEKKAANFVLSTGRRAKSRAGAHRATRSRRHLGASVNKAGDRNMAKWSHKGNVLTLGRKDTKRWEDGGPDGDEFRRLIKQMAKDRANKTRKSVEIYAATSAGGWMAEQIQPDSFGEPESNRAGGKRRSEIRLGAIEKFGRSELGEVPSAQITYEHGVYIVRGFNSDRKHIVEGFRTITEARRLAQRITEPSVASNRAGPEWAAGAPPGPSRFGHEKTDSDIHARIKWERWMAEALRRRGDPSSEIIATGHDQTAAAYEDLLVRRKSA